MNFIKTIPNKELLSLSAEVTSEINLRGLSPRKTKAAMHCLTPNCTEPILARGLCDGHYHYTLGRVKLGQTSWNSATQSAADPTPPKKTYRKKNYDHLSLDELFALAKAFMVRPLFTPGDAPLPGEPHCLYCSANTKAGFGLCQKHYSRLYNIRRRWPRLTNEVLIEQKFINPSVPGEVRAIKMMETKRKSLNHPTQETLMPKSPEQEYSM